VKVIQTSRAEGLQQQATLKIKFWDHILFFSVGVKTIFDANLLDK